MRGVPPSASVAHDELLAGVLEAARRTARALVVVHTPKSAGTALAATARAAGWAVMSSRGLLSSRRRCPHCGPRPCALAVEWIPDSTIGAAGPHLDLEHVEVGPALEAADVIARVGCDVQVVMTVRDPVDRLTSLFRYYWRDAFAGGAEALVRAAGSGVRRATAIRIARTASRVPRSSLAGEHAGRLARLRALDALHYAEHRRGGMVIDGVTWLAALDRFGAGPGTRYWMDEFGVTPSELTRFRDAGRIELVASRRLDDLTRSVHGRPSIRANVSSDTLLQPVERALDVMRGRLVELAGRDAPFAGLIAEAGA